jgi:hypothetical protein
MIVTKEYRASLDGLIGRTKDRMRGLKDKVRAGKDDKRPALAKEQRRLELLEFFRDNIDVSKKWSNEKIDAMIKYVKSHGIDMTNLEAELASIEKAIAADE